MVADAKALGRAQPLPISLLGVAFDPLTLSEAARRVAEAVEDRRPRFFVTANVDFLVKARRDGELRRILLDADHVLCDGTPLVWASRWLGNALPGRAAGSDLVPELIALAAERRWRIFLLGGGPGVAAEAARRLHADHPDLPPVAWYAPPIQPLEAMDHPGILARIRAAAPDLLLVSFGCPKQEKWIAAHYRESGVPVSIGVGATVDFLAGRVPRAPQWMRRGGIEWTFRLAQEPRRLFGRYADDALHFFPALWRQRRVLPPSQDGRGGGAAPALQPTDYGLRVHAGSRLDRAAFEYGWAFWAEAIEPRGHCLLELEAVASIDSTGIAVLSWWRKRLASVRRNLILFRPSRAVLAALRSLRLAEHFVITDGRPPAIARTGFELYPEP